MGKLTKGQLNRRRRAVTLGRHDDDHDDEAGQSHSLDTAIDIERGKLRAHIEDMIGIMYAARKQGSDDKAWMIGCWLLVLRDYFIGDGAWISYLQSRKHLPFKRTTASKYMRKAEAAYAMMPGAGVLSPEVNGKRFISFS
jgi:hypothetical protein